MLIEVGYLTIYIVILDRATEAVDELLKAQGLIEKWIR